LVPPGSQAVPPLPRVNSADQPAAAEGHSGTLELVRQAKGGDTRALSALLERHQARIRGLVRQRLGRDLRRELDSGDLVQEALVEVVEAFPRFEMRDERSFVRWLATLVENRLRELARYHGREKRDHSRRVPLASEDGSLGTPQDPGPSPSQEARGHEAQERLESALRDLPANWRAALELRRSGLEFEPIAQRLGLPSAAAARMLHTRARVALLARLPAGLLDLPAEGSASADDARPTAAGGA
jgi:RNA polymerase sigma factor (sigma-70 family)